MSQVADSAEHRACPSMHSDGDGSIRMSRWKMRLLALAARASVIGGIVLIIAGLYPPAWADLSNASILLIGLLAAYVVMSLRRPRR